MPVQLAHSKPYHAPTWPPGSNIKPLGDSLSGKKYPFCGYWSRQPCSCGFICRRIWIIIEVLVDLMLTIILFSMTARGFGPTQDIFLRANENPVCSEVISAYPADHSLDFAEASQSLTSRLTKHSSGASSADVSKATRLRACATKSIGWSVDEA